MGLYRYYWRFRLFRCGKPVIWGYIVLDAEEVTLTSVAFIYQRVACTSLNLMYAATY
jgi:hypothetical protein